MRIKKPLQHEEISLSIVRIAYKLLGGDRMSLNYGTDVQIHGAEMHILCHIKQHPGSHISEIARSLNVTRGAVSQIVAKLKRKGLISQVDSEDGRCILFELTQKGETAYNEHEKIHFLFVGYIKRILNGYSEDKVPVVLDFIKQLETSVDELVISIQSMQGGKQ
jgi:DNA-binding MarR family transcriptional regulator